MFGKLSLWAANTYHGPSVPKLDIQHVTRDAPATHTDESYDSEPSFDIDINPRIMAEWSAEQKAEFIIDNRELLPLIYAADNQTLLMDKNQRQINLDSTYEILYQMPMYEKNFNRIIDYIYRAKFISAYLQANHGNLSDNLIAYLEEYDEEPHKITNIKDAEKYLLSLINHDIPYVIKFGYHPVHLSTDPPSVHRVLLNLKNKPDIARFITPFLSAQDLIAKYCCESVEKTHEMLSKPTSDIRQMYRLTYQANAFYDFVQLYKNGIPPDMYARWIEYDQSMYIFGRVPQFIKHADRIIKPEDYGMLYSHLMLNPVLMNEVLQHMQGNPRICHQIL